MNALVGLVAWTVTALACVVVAATVGVAKIASWAAARRRKAHERRLRDSSINALLPALEDVGRDG